jgi:hypothetical protein
MLQVSSENLAEQRLSVAKAFWPHSPGSPDRVTPCSSLMGLSAHALLRISSDAMPRLECFWDKKRIEYHVSDVVKRVSTDFDVTCSAPKKYWGQETRKIITNFLSWRGGEKSS